MFVTEEQVEFIVLGNLPSISARTGCSTSFGSKRLSLAFGKPVLQHQCVPTFPNGILTLNPNTAEGQPQTVICEAFFLNTLHNGRTVVIEQILRGPAAT